MIHHPDMDEDTLFVAYSFRSLTSMWTLLVYGVHLILHPEERNLCVVDLDLDPGTVAVTSVQFPDVDVGSCRLTLLQRVGPVVQIYQLY